MAWTDQCKIEAVSYIDRKIKEGLKVRAALKAVSDESDIPVSTLNRWKYPRKESVVKNDHKTVEVANDPTPKNDQDSKSNIGTPANDSTSAVESDEATDPKKVIQDIMTHRKRIVNSLEQLHKLAQTGQLTNDRPFIDAENQISLIISTAQSMGLKTLCQDCQGDRTKE